MSHIRDKWVTRDGRQTARFGHGKRWRATWTDLDGSEHGKCFDRKADAAHWLAVVGRAWLRAELLLAADGDGIDPSGFSGKSPTIPSRCTSASPGTSSAGSAAISTTAPSAPGSAGSP